jgi:hypothetical protein
VESVVCLHMVFKYLCVTLIRMIRRALAKEVALRQESD